MEGGEKPIVMYIKDGLIDEKVWGGVICLDCVCFCAFLVRVSFNMKEVFFYIHST